MKAVFLSFLFLFSLFSFAEASAEPSANAEPSTTSESKSKTVTELSNQVAQKPTFELSKEMQQVLEQQALEQKENREVSDGLTTSQRFVKYLKSGFLHIIPMGIDHILFVLGLFLATLQMSKLFWQVTAFTIAHSITLALAATGVITLSGSIVEPLIALSIIYVAYENVRKTEVDNSRIVLIFVFGLLHGLGFASVLQEFGLPTQSFVASLFAFNIGVEVGQLTVIAAAFAMVFWWRNKPSYRAFVQIPGSVFIGMIGLYWTIERVIG